LVAFLLRGDTSTTRPLQRYLYAPIRSMIVDPIPDSA